MTYEPYLQYFFFIFLYSVSFPWVQVEKNRLVYVYSLLLFFLFSSFDLEISWVNFLSFFLFNIHLFIYLGCTGSQLWQACSFVAARCLLSCSTWAPQLWHANSQLQHACGIQFPDQGLNPGPLHQEHGVLTTAPPEKFLGLIFK